jgi:hypothetical protein
VPTPTPVPVALQLPKTTPKVRINPEQNFDEGR